MRRRLLLIGLVLGLLAVLPASASATQVYVANESTATITAFNIGAGGSVTQIPCTGSGCATGTCPEGLAITPDDGFLYSTDCEANVVNEFTIGSAGGLSQLCTSACPPTGGDPLGDAVTPNGKFLFVANGNTPPPVSGFTIGSGGSLTPVTCPGCTNGSFPVGLAVSPNGKYVYVADQDVQGILEYSVGSDGSLTKLCTTSCPSAGSRPFDLAVAPNGKYLYVTDNSADQVVPFAINSDGTLTSITCATCATGVNPRGIAVTSDGKYVYTANNGSISAFSISATGALTPITCVACTTGSAYAGVVVEPSSRYVYANIDGDGTATLAPFAIGSTGSLTPISCSPSVCTFPGGGFDISNIAASPDEAPVAKFTHGTARAGKSTSFNGSGSTAYQSATIARYDWSFGDGKKALNGGPRPKHKYAKPGYYKVKLTVTDSLGCSTKLTYTGQTVSCNGSSVATITHRVHVTAAKATVALRNLPTSCVRNSTTIGVRVHTATGSGPHKTSVSVDGQRVARSQKLSFSVTIALNRLKVGRNSVTAVSVDRFGRRSRATAHVSRCSTSAAFTG